MFSDIRRKLTKLVLLAAVVLAFVCAAQRGQAQSDGELQRKAATLFDRGVAEFSASQYEAAARSFLAAADVLPSKDALKNAFAAAQRAEQPRLIAQTAARLLELPGLDERSRRDAQRALERAAPQLARVDVACAPAPCGVRIDGESYATGRVYLNPGMHEFVASNTEGWQVAVPASCGAGAQCQVSLELAPAREAPSKPPVEAAPVVPREPAPQPATERAQESAAPSAEKAGDVGKTERARNVPALVSFVGAATVTAAFVALVSWSGAEALSAHRKYKDEPQAYDEDETRRLARRTDYLTIGAVVSAAATTAIGVWWVDFGGRRRAALSLAPGRGITLVGRF